MTIVRVQTIQPDVRHTHLPAAPSYHLTLDWKTKPESQGQCSPVPNTPHMDPPRPLEPRPTHERSSSAQKTGRDDPFNSNVGANVPRHSTYQSLPGVKALLTPVETNGRPPYESWHNEQSQYERPQYQSMPMQPPHHAYSQRNEYHATQDRRLELPVLETQPRHSHPPITSPHHDHVEVSREYVDSAISRPRQQSAGSYAGGSASSPYTPANFDDTASRGSGGAYDRSSNSAYTPTSAEVSRRYLGIRDFPGEGQFHVYEGGHRIPTHVDGEQVNPQWGLTKAMKPRKRLALACLDCREKKIKCEPGVNSCLQCEKAKRPCRRYFHPSSHMCKADDSRSVAMQGQQNDNASVDWSSNADSPPASRPSATPHSARDEHDGKRRAEELAIITQGGAKRQKSVSPMPLETSLQQHTNGMMSGSVSASRFSEDEDPFVIDRALTLQLIESYFAHANNGIYTLFPRDSFLHWVTTYPAKDEADRMLLYAMMAVGAAFIPSHHQLGAHLNQIATKALTDKYGKFSLQIIHTRLLLSLYNFARGTKGLAWEHCGGAMRSLSALRYNNEEGCNLRPDAKSKKPEAYCLPHSQVVECRRRAFWCGFMMDRFSGFCDGMLCTVEKADIYLRLPSSDIAFDQDKMSHPAPFLDNGLIERDETSHTQSVHSPMAHLTLITSIWGDVMNCIYRGVHRSPAGHAAAYEACYAETYTALDVWMSRLPEHLQYTEHNVRRSLREGYAGELITLHILYHYVLIKLNRWMRFSLIQDQISRNISEAHIHAHQLLGMIVTLASIRESSPSGSPRPRFSTPFIGNAILSAIDVVSAGGHDSTLKQSLEAIRTGLDFLRDLLPIWPTTAEDLVKAGQKRFLMLNNVITRPYKASGGCWLGRKWGLESALETELNIEDDCIYGVKAEDFYEAIDKMMKQQSRSLELTA